MDLPVWLQQVVVFFSDGQFLRLGVATMVLFGIVFVTWWVYRSLSDRNLFNFLQKHGELPNPTTIDRLLYGLRYAVLFPLYSFLGFLIIACSLFIVTHPDTAAAQEQLLFIAVALVSTVRIASYVSERLAEDTAKLVPLSMVAVVILNPTLEFLTVILPGVRNFVLLIPSFLKYLVFIVLLEVALRLASWVAGRAGFDPKSEEGEE